MALRIEAGEWRVVLMSGGGFSTESDLIETGADVGAHILLFGDGGEGPVHHPDFVGHVRPRYIICDGAEVVPFRSAHPSHVLDLGATGALLIIFYPDRTRIEPMLQPGVWEFFLR